MCSQSDVVTNMSVCRVSKGSDTLQKETRASSFIQEQRAFFTASGLDADQPSLVMMTVIIFFSGSTNFLIPTQNRVDLDSVFSSVIC